MSQRHPWTSRFKYILDLLVDVQSKSNMSMVIITHDLGVAREADEIMVMYGGRIMEKALQKLSSRNETPVHRSLTFLNSRLNDPKHTVDTTEGFPDKLTGPKAANLLLVANTHKIFA